MATTPPQPGAPASGAQTPQQLNPEQIKQMQLVVKQCMQLLLQDQTADMIVAKAKQGQPAQLIAQIVSPLLSQVYQAAEQSGVKIGMVTMMVAGVQVMGLLAEMLFQADVIPTQEEAAQVVGQAAKIAVDQHNAMVGQGGQPGAAKPPQAGAGAPPQPAAAGGMIAQGGV